MEWSGVGVQQRVKWSVTEDVGSAQTVPSDVTQLSDSIMARWWDGGAGDAATPGRRRHETQQRRRPSSTINRASHSIPFSTNHTPSVSTFVRYSTARNVHADAPASSDNRWRP